MRSVCIASDTTACCSREDAPTARAEPANNFTQILEPEPPGDGDIMLHATQTEETSLQLDDEDDDGDIDEDELGAVSNLIDHMANIASVM